MFYLYKLKENLLKNKIGKFLLFGGFTFFFIKGLVWLGIFVLVGLGLVNSI
tara:strand:+ start:603 stop:755 length:153 start_codon:yes stop_codon:yes gene_type:complete